MTELTSIIQMDKDLLADFFHDYNDGASRCEKLTQQLNSLPYDQTMSEDLLRTVHTLKNSLLYIGLKPVSILLMNTELVLKALCKGKLAYNDALGELINTTIGVTKNLANESIQGLANSLSQNEISDIANAINDITITQGSEQRKHIQQALSLMGKEVDVSAPAPTAPVERACFLEEFVTYGVEINQDLRLFHDLITAAEKRTPYWMDRSYLLCKLALRMNQNAAHPVNPTQLTGAVLMHDFAMTFTPLAILNKKKPFTGKDKKTIASHVRYSYDFLNRLGWEEAAEITLQHHERCDGKGYPKGLTEMEICDGAKILALVDTFYACTNSADKTPIRESSSGRKLMHTILEINNNIGTQFSAQWVNIFNKVVDKNSFKDFSKIA